MNQQAKNRTLGQRFADRLWGNYAKLPAPRTDYTTTFDVRIPMRDRVELLAEPLGAEGRGVGDGARLVPVPASIWSGRP